MTRRVNIDNLRSVDPVTLDIVVQEPLRRPLVQLTLGTVADMCALSEVESLPKNLRKQLQTFTERMGPEIADLPDGEPFLLLLADFEALPPARIPVVLRNHFAPQLEQRHELKTRVQALLDSWSKEPSEVVVPGTGKPLIHRVKKAEPPTAAAAKAAPKPRAPAGEKAPKATRAAPVKFVDQDRQKWIRDTVLERLDDYMEQGLREDVLIAGVKHRGRAHYPDMTNPEVLGVMRDLGTAGRVKQSAGRWRRMMTW